MKKAIAAALLGAILAVPAAKGIINITWYAAFGFYHPSNPGVTPLLDPPVQATLIQLISAGGNGVIDIVDPFAPNFLGGDDILLASIVFTNTSNNNFNEYAAVAYGTYTQAFANFNFYGRIFQDDTPAPNEKYFDTILGATSDQVPPGTQDFDFNNGNTAGDNLTLTIVPEPTTIAFVGFGLMGLAARALRRRS